jgi:16S rRNA (guanine527-N7)-methyltransferase
MEEFKKEQIKFKLESLLEREFKFNEIEQLELFINEIKLHSLKQNLVSKGDLSRIIERHIADSLVLDPYIKKAKNVIDVGSGAGFPGIPLAITSDKISFSLVEPRTKRVSFLEHITKSLKLDNVAVIKGKIEEQQRLVSGADAIIFRAVGGISHILGHIKAHLRSNATVFVLTSQGRVPEKIKGLTVKAFNYRLNGSDWKGSIWQFNVSRGT